MSDNRVMSQCVMVLFFFHFERYAFLSAMSILVEFVTKMS